MGRKKLLLAIACDVALLLIMLAVAILWTGNWEGFQP